MGLCLMVTGLVSHPQIQSPYIEEFLQYTSTLQQNNGFVLDLLWRYYEKNKNYLAAAKILDQLAHRDRFVTLSCSPLYNSICLLVLI